MHRIKVVRMKQYGSIGRRISTLPIDRLHSCLGIARSSGNTRWGSFLDAAQVFVVQLNLKRPQILLEPFPALCSRGWG